MRRFYIPASLHELEALEASDALPFGYKQQQMIAGLMECVVQWHYLQKLWGVVEGKVEAHLQIELIVA